MMIMPDDARLTLTTQGAFLGALRILNDDDDDTRRH